MTFSFCLLASGCTWLDKFRTKDGGAVATGEVPKAKVEQLVDRLNANAQTVSVVRYDDVSIKLDGPEVPTLAESMANSSLVAARPKLLRLNAGKNVASNLLQMGSNETEFWMLTEGGLGADRAFVVCSHQEFPQQAHKLPVPVDPDWALLALGVGGTDPDYRLYRVETDVRNRLYRLTKDETTPAGRKVERTTVFAADQPTGDAPLVRQHVITEPGGKKVIARADILSVYRVPNSGGAEVPTALVLEWPEQKFKMKLTLRQPKVNEVLDPAQVQALFGRPAVPGVRPVNLADLQFKPTARGAAPERKGVFGLRRD